MSQPSDETVVVPNLYIRSVYELFCFGDSFPIVTANHLITS